MFTRTKKTDIDNDCMLLQPQAGPNSVSRKASWNVLGFFLGLLVARNDTFNCAVLCIGTQTCHQPRVATSCVTLIDCPSVGLPVCLPACLPVCLSICLRAYLPACLPACLPAYVRLRFCFSIRLLVNRWYTCTAPVENYRSVTGSF